MIIARPARGTRPANRRATILTAATELIRDRGYEHVSMGDIADGVGVSAAALYRHFSSKERLLADVIGHGLAPVQSVVEDLHLGDHDTLARLADLALDNPAVGTLLVREIRHLSAEEQAKISAQIQAIAVDIAAKCAQVRPDLDRLACDLLAWALLGLLISPSFYRINIARAEHASMLADLAGRVLSAPVPTGFALQTVKPGGGLLPFTRREALLAQATTLFAQQRYAGVGIEDVAGSLGMAGPSIYNYFASKSELLATALERGAAYLYVQVAEVLAAADDPSAALRGLVSSYAGFGVARPDLGAILLTEVRNLAEPHRQQALQAQRDYVNEWAHLLDECAAADANPTTHRLRVHAALSVINTVIQIDHVRSAAQAVPAITSVVVHLLQLD